MNTHLGDRKMRIRVGILAKTAVLSWLVTLFTLGFFITVMLPGQREMLLENLESKARGVSVSLQDVAAGAAVTEDFSEIVDHCQQVILGDPSIEFLILTRNDGFALVNTRKGWSSEQMDEIWRPEDRTPFGAIGYQAIVERDAFKYSRPFNYSGIEWGWIHVGLSLDSYQANLAASYQRTAVISAFCLLISLIASVIYAKRLVTPIIRLRLTARQVADGDLSARADVQTGDEVEALALTFNYMTQSIQDREEKVRKQNRQLSELVTEKVLHAGDLLAAARRITEASSVTLETDRVSVWLVKENCSVLECLDQFDLQSKKHAKAPTVARKGNELYFEALEQSRVLTVDDVSVDPRVASLFPAYLNPQGISAVMDASIRLEGRVVGVVCNEHRGSFRHWTSEEENFAGSIADLIALAMEACDRQVVQEELVAAKESAETANEAKSRFLANMSHEIRTPLNGVVGMLRLLQDGTLDSKQKRFVNKGIISAQALLVVINDVLDFSKIEAGRLEIEMLPFNVIETTENAVQIFAYRAEEKNLELACFFHRNVPSVVNGDPTRIGQVLNNLIGNAIKFTAHGSITIRVWLESEDAEAVVIGFSVKDTGLGISKDERDRIFEPFLQGDSSTTRRFGGTGLGLGISRQLVHLMGGDIHVDSQPGAGSIFRFTSRFKKIPQRGDSTSAIKSIAGLRVLVVDDHAVTREVLCYAIETWGGITSEAETGADALRMMRNSPDHPFDLAIVDWNMPGMTGEELGQRIQADSLLTGTPLILLSSIAEVDGCQLRQSGFSAWLSKPARQSELYDAIVNTINKVPCLDVMPKRDDTNRSSLRTDLKVLLAEDNEINQEVVDEILKASGCFCEIVNNGREAVEAAANQTYDVILMDCMMPEMDGYEATRQIREAEKAGGRHVPIVALTANAMKGDREQCIQAGMDDYLSKPLDPGRTIRIVCKWTESASESEQPVLRGASVPVADKQKSGLFDSEALLARCMGNQKLADKLVVKFMDQVGTDLRTLRASFAAGEAAGMISASHRIKGAAANLAMVSLSKAASVVEACARENNLDEANREVDNLDAELLRLQQYFVSIKSV